MGRHAEVSARFKAMRAKHADRLNALDERMDAHESTSDQVFRSYEGAIEQDEMDMKEMENDITDMKNEFDGGKTEKPGDKFPLAGQTTKVG